LEGLLPFEREGKSGSYTSLNGATLKLLPESNNASKVFLLVRRSFFLKVKRVIAQKYKRSDGIVRPFVKTDE